MSLSHSSHTCVRAFPFFPRTHTNTHTNTHRHSCPFHLSFLCLSTCFHLWSQAGNGSASPTRTNNAAWLPVVCVCICVCAIYCMCEQGAMYSLQCTVSETKSVCVCVSGFLHCQRLKRWSRLFPASAVFCGRGFGWAQQQQRPGASRPICK